MINIDDLAVPDEIKVSLKSFEHIAVSKHAGKGQNSHVFFGLNRVLDQRVALKYYYWAGDPRFHVEPQALAQLQSPRVIHILDAQTVGAEYALFITPFYEHGDLDDLMEREILPLRRSLDLTIDVLTGTSALHAQRLIHRDLKPENILIGDDGRPLIGDFGSVKKVPDRHTGVPGSAHSALYRPPEAIQGNVYSQQGDLYQCGILLYQLLGGWLPYDDVLWLNKTQRAEYANSDNYQRTKLVDGVLQGKILAGSLLRIQSVRPWVPRHVLRVIRKACNVDRTARFGNCAEFMGALQEARAKCPDWCYEGSVPVVCDGKRVYRVVAGNGGAFVEKNAGGGWRRDNSFMATSFKRLITEVSAKVAT